ncbi:MAG: D-alanyl-D-alanine carboxypeptidase family protein [Francisellaceae bacterium]
MSIMIQKRRLHLLQFAVWLFAALPILLSANSRITNDKALLLEPYPITLNAKSWVLMDYDTGDIIAEKNMNQRHAPASLSKIMTLYIAASEIQQGMIKPKQMIIVSDQAAATGGSKMFIRSGQKVSVQNLMKGIAIQSGNDASIALAEYIAGSDSNFAQLMNQSANAIDMNNSHFMNASGLPADDQYTTAKDMAILSRHFIQRFPQVYALFREPEFSWAGITQQNRNSLIKEYPGADGIKTGYTDKAGYNLVSSVILGNRRFIAVVMGAPSARIREQDSMRLLNYGFGKFENITLYRQDSLISLPSDNINDAPKDQMLKLYGKETLIKTLPKSYQGHLTQKVVTLPGLKAPIFKNQQVGNLIFVVNDKEIARLPLYAQNSLDKIGFFEKWFS